MRIEKKPVVKNVHVGLWRSLVARPSGGRKVAGSSPASPTRMALVNRQSTPLKQLVSKGVGRLHPDNYRHLSAQNALIDATFRDRPIIFEVFH